MLAARERVRDPGRAAGRGRRRDGLLDPDPGAGRGRRHGGRAALPRRPLHGRGRRSSSGDQRGRELGFPTANIVPDDRLAIPGHGVYAAFANGVPAAVNVGVRPTFETGRGVLIETYLIDRDEDLYGQRAAGRLRRAPARREALRQRRGADRPDAASTSRTRSASVLASSGRDPPGRGIFTDMSLTKEKKDRADRQVRPRRRRHRLRRGPGRPAHRADQRAHRAPAHARQGPPLAPRPADAGRQAPPHAALPRAQRPRALPRPGRRARPAAMIAAGEPAPDFTLRDQDGEKVSLADFRGRKVLLVFYPLDFSPVCTRPALDLPGGQAGDRGQGRRAGRDQRRQQLRPQGLPGEARHRHPAARRLRAQGRGRARLRLLPRDGRPRQPHPGPVDEDGKVEWVYESPTPLEIPGANLIFDALCLTALS